MTRQILTCLRCGHAGPDVTLRWPNLEREANEQGETVRDVEVEIVEQLRHVQARRTMVVPERYGSTLEPRCDDRGLCLARWRKATEPEVPAWRR